MLILLTVLLRHILAWSWLMDYVILRKRLKEDTNKPAAMGIVGGKMTQ